MLELRLRGYSARAIADRMGMPLRTVQRRLSRALHVMHEESADEARRTVETRYDRMLTRLHVLLDSGQLTLRDEVAVINSITTLEAARVRLLGIAVPPAEVVRMEREEGR